MRRVKRFDSSNFLSSDEEIREYLNEMFRLSNGDFDVMMFALSKAFEAKSKGLRHLIKIDIIPLRVP